MKSEKNNFEVDKNLPNFGRKYNNESTKKELLNLLEDFNIPDLRDFLERLKNKGIMINSDNEEELDPSKFVLKFIEMLNNKEVVPYYSKLLENLLKTSLEDAKDKFLGTIKSPDIDEYSGEVVSLMLDLYHSTSLSQKDLKENMTKFIYLVNFFEYLYEDAKLFVYSLNGDEINLGFFSDKLSLEEKLKVFSLLSIFLELFTKQKFHTVVLTWEKEKGENISGLFAENIINTPISHELSFEMKQAKISELPNYVDKGILEKLGRLPRKLLKDSGYNLLLHKKIKNNDLLEALQKFSLDDLLQHILVRLIYNVVINNLQTKFPEGNLEKILLDLVEINTVEKDEEIITYGQEVNEIYMVLEGSSELYLNGNQLTKKVIDGKTIFGEMSLQKGTATATVVLKKGTKYLKIKKKFIDTILKDNSTLKKSIIVDSKYKELLERLLRRYIKGREIENIKVQSYFQTLLNNYEENVDTIKQAWEDFLTFIISSSVESLVNKGKTIIEEGKENTGVYVIRKGSQIELQRGKDKKTIVLKDDMLVGEGAFLSFLENEKPVANATIKIIKGSYKYMEMNELKNQLNKLDQVDQKNLKRILKAFFSLRKASSNVINCTGENTTIIGHQKRNAA